MSIVWYLAVSGLVFSIGVFGLIVRRNPLVIFLCLEMLLGAGNLAMLSFDRWHGGNDGAIMSLIVMVVAASEVTVGLGIVVAMHRRGRALDVDKITELRG